MPALDPVKLPLQGPHLIEASAGTGKTYTIATLFVRLVLEQELSVDRILVVTFTEAAAAELRDRIRRRLRDALWICEHGGDDADPVLAEILEGRKASRDRDRDRLAVAIRTFDEVAISTIHGFCHRVLHDSAFETGVGFDTELVPNQQPLIDLCVRDFWAREIYRADPMFVGHLLRRRVSPKGLMRLANLAVSMPRAPLLPSKTEVDAHPDVAPFLAAYGRARVLWHRDGHEILEMLLAHPGLHKTHYPKSDMPGWFQVLTAFFREPDPGASLGCAQLEKFAARSLHKWTRKEYVKRGEVPEHPFFEACDELLDARAPLLANFDLRYVELRRKAAEYVRRELPKRKRVAGVFGFDDLLQLLAQALRRRGGKDLARTIRGRYQAALIDEFQDTDPVQYEIFRSIYGGTKLPVFLIGDPKQAIYGFRGADVFAYLGAADDVPKSARHTMDTNWRSDPGVLQAIEHLFAVQRPFLLPQIEFIPVGARPGAEAGLYVDDEALAPFEIRFQPREGTGARGKNPTIPATWTEPNLPERVAADIAALLNRRPKLRSGSNERPVHAGDIAVLVRKNVQAQQIQGALRRLGVPSVVYGDASVYATHEANELYRVLSAVAEPTHTGLLRAAITTELLGVTATELEAMSTDDTAWNTWIQRFRRWHRLWIERGFIQMFRALLTEADTNRRLLGLLDGERRLTNLLHLAELLHKGTTADHLGPAGLLRWFFDQRRSDQMAAEEVKLRLEKDDQAVQLITIHRSKGLEYPIVYCPYLWDPDSLRPDEEENLRFHDPADANRLKLDISNKGNRFDRAKLPNVIQARFENDAETLRLLYVALTRARHRCVLVWGGFEGAHKSALGYLLHADDVDMQFGGTLELVSSKIKGKTDDQLLEKLRARAHPSWTISTLGDAPGEPYQPPTPPAPRELVLKQPRLDIDRAFRTSSFTQMTSGPSHGVDFDLVDGRDRDPVIVDSASTPTAHAADIPMAQFPGGPRVGNVFHSILEHLDFTASDTAVEEAAHRALRTHGLDAEALGPAATQALRDVLDTPLLAPPSPPLRLRDVKSSQRLNELEFVFPVAPDDGVDVTRADLANVFAAHGEGVPAGYAGRVARLGFAPLRGYLKGFIDLIFRHEGRWYLVDYKTNHLGTTFGDYDPSSLDDVMARDHYVLQYHLYTVALFRHLQTRVADFDYERDFGGVAYLFLRGMRPDDPGGTGIYFDRPPRARIEALSNALVRPQREVLR